MEKIFNMAIIFFTLLNISVNAINKNDEEYNKKNISNFFRPKLFVQKEENLDMISPHLTYTIGAYSGALVGSFFVHIFDTVATYQSQQMFFKGALNFTKTTLRSYLPVGLWVVPARSISFGVYSFSQDGIENIGLGIHSKVLGASIISGLCLAVLSTPAEFIKTQKQLKDGGKLLNNSISISEIVKSSLPLSCRIVPTVSIMLAGTTYIQSALPVDNVIVSTSISAVLAAHVAHLFATPSENIRIQRIATQDYKTSTKSLLKDLWQTRTLYSGFWARSLSLGVQAAFTLSAANSINSFVKPDNQIPGK